jgi:hypothetical protein
MLYFMIPFALAITIMGARELWLNVVQPWQRRRLINGNGGDGTVSHDSDSRCDTVPDSTAAPPPAVKTRVSQD